MGWLVPGLSLARRGRWGTAIALAILALACLGIAAASWAYLTPHGGDANTYNDLGIVMGLGGYLMLAFVGEREASAR